MPGWDPSLTLEQTIAAYLDDARRTYGEERARELEGPLRTLAHEVWLIAQEPLDPNAAQPDVILNPENL
jgi:hypothetical protein